jgi:hypothetical protein
MNEVVERSKALPPRKCTSCDQHSGLVRTYEIHGEIMKRFDVYMIDQTKRSFSLLIGIILCLVTGLVTIGVSTTILFNSTVKAHVADTRTFETIYVYEVIDDRAVVSETEYFTEN